MAEKRQVGELTAFGRDGVHGKEVLLFRDPRKVDMAAGIPFFHETTSNDPEKNKAWNFVGGGRGAVAEENRQETLVETLNREAAEELETTLFDFSVLQFLQQEWPVGVAQLKENEGKLNTNLFAVTSVWVDVNDLSKEQRVFLEQAEKQGKAQWFSLSELVFLLEYFAEMSRDNVFMLSALTQRVLLSADMRPQVLTVAKYWHEYWQQNAGEGLSQLGRKNAVQTGNQRLYEAVEQVSNKGKNGAINNGTFDTETGFILPADKLPEDVGEFLYPQL
jgi:hypothetical protein